MAVTFLWSILKQLAGVVAYRPVSLFVMGVLKNSPIDYDLLCTVGLAPPRRVWSDAIECFFLCGCLDIPNMLYFAQIAALRCRPSLIKQRGSLFQLCLSTQRAWHAGQSHFSSVRTAAMISLWHRLEALMNSLMKQDNINSGWGD